MESPPARRIHGFPFAEESDMYPEFRQSDEENDFDPGPLPAQSCPPLRPPALPNVLQPGVNAAPQLQAPALHRAMEGMSFAEGSALHASGQARPPATGAFPRARSMGI
ncbi:hypothetical protein KUCAC02_005708 [Chaenocephalus aceratus]|uniref:Uncharacterized protein n=1 Tax=Chaenocephalus aceratus TaxID=36190 RepID=A0ACB9WQX4_CHAAC|nr:hypothetical protein KUCAC02_005708 [Chaenocephalus aceratus]